MKICGSFVWQQQVPFVCVCAHTHACMHPCLHASMHIHHKRARAHTHTRLCLCNVGSHVCKGQIMIETNSFSHVYVSAYLHIFTYLHIYISIHLSIYLSAHLYSGVGKGQIMIDTNSFVGTEEYIAPEVIKGSGQVSHEYSLSSVTKSLYNVTCLLVYSTMSVGIMADS